MQHKQQGVWLPTRVYKPKLFLTAYGLWPAMNIRGIGCAASAEFDFKPHGSSKFPCKFLPTNFLSTEWQELARALLQDNGVILKLF